mmetsp:Transcript_9458/g.20084  ORF Transcript_9458/g.20084 Transcript_9458/m.20084 type:complete len:299 (+) Transcript_9458:221-1117(+)
MTDQTDEEWNFYFGRGRSRNHQRKSSKVSGLLQNLAPRYRTCDPGHRRLFAKHEVYNAVLKKGGSFFKLQNNMPVDVTADEFESTTKIMQAFRDIKKQCKLASTQSHLGSSHLTTSSRKNKIKRMKTSSSQKNKTKRPRSETPSTKNPSPTMPSSPPKPRCVKPSIIEPPFIDCVRDARRMVDVNESIPEISAVSSEMKPSSNHKIPVSGGGSAQKPLVKKDTIRNLSTDDMFDTMAVEEPKLESSFSALIMADEITADLPTDSQKSINQNLHERVQRLENLVGMLMQQQNVDLERLL